MMNTVILVVTLSFVGFPDEGTTPPPPPAPMTLAAMEVTSKAQCIEQGEHLMTVIGVESFRTAEFDCITVPEGTDY